MTHVARNRASSIEVLIGEVSFVSLLTPRTPDSVVAPDYNLHTVSPEVRSTGLDFHGGYCSNRIQHRVEIREIRAREGFLHPYFLLVGIHAGGNANRKNGLRWEMHAVSQIVM